MVTYQRHHYLYLYGYAFGFHVHGSLDDGTCLHLGDFGIGVAQTTAAVAEHGVDLCESFNLSLDSLVRYAELGSEFTLFLFEVGNELMQGGVEQTNGYGKAVHYFEQALEVAALYGEELVERLATSGFVVCENHLTYGFDTIALEEHVFGAAEADALCAEVERLFGVAGGVGVCAYLEVSVFVSQFHQFAEVT